MSISFTDQIKVPDEVLVSGLQSESVMLNLKSERYFGLDEMGTSFPKLLSASDCIRTAYEVLLDEYDVEPEVLRRGLSDLLARLIEEGLVEVSGE